MSNLKIEVTYEPESNHEIATMNALDQIMDMCSTRPYVDQDTVGRIARWFFDKYNREHNASGQPRLAERKTDDE